MKRSFIIPVTFLIAALTITICALAHCASKDYKQDTPKVIIDIREEGKLSSVTVLSDPRINSFREYQKLSMSSKKENPSEYSKRFKSVADAFVDTYRVKVADIYSSYGISSKGLLVIINSHGQLESISIGYRLWENSTVPPTEEQVLSIFNKLRSVIVFPDWNTEPQYIEFGVSIPSKREE